MQLNAKKLANAATLAVSILYVVCTLFVAVAPEAAMAITAGIMHIPTLGETLGDVEVTLDGFLLGFISLLVTSYVGVYLATALYNRSVKA